LQKYLIKINKPMKTSLIIIAIASSLFAKSQVTYHTPAGKDSSRRKNLWQQRTLRASRKISSI
jgi:gamma-glutamylcysteine synthetase